MFTKDQNTIAEIAGQTVPIQLFQAKVDENIENYKRNTGQSTLDQATIENLQDQTWEQIVRDYLMTDQLEELGIGLSGEELFDMVQGNNIDPQIRQIPVFQNPETGQFDRNRVVQFLQTMDLDPSGNQKASWTGFEAALMEQKISEKYNTLISKGLYVTSNEAKDELANKTASYDFDYIKVPFTTVADSAISISESDIKTYYANNKEDFKQEESREINYIVFPIIASVEDEAAIKKELSGLTGDFEAEENSESFVKLNSDAPFNGQYLTQSELSVETQSLFDAEEGTVYGPYKEGNAYKLAKVVSFKNIPDSVKARHILIQPSQALSQVAAVAQADSLLEVVKKGGNFAALAEKFSVDGSAKDGGDLGWFVEGSMVKPFNDACFFGKKGDIVKVESQFGIHIVEVLAQAKTTKKLQLAIIQLNIEPSSDTYQGIYSQASKFGGTNRTSAAFVTAADKEGYSLRYATLSKDERKVANLDNPRQLVRWSYEADNNSVSDIFEFGENYVIACLKTVREEGYSSIDDVKQDIERRVKNEKKAEYLVSEINTAKKGTNTLQAISDQLSQSVQEAKNTNFAAYSLTGVGFEPELQGFVAAMEKDVISEPVKGKSGVFVIQVKNVTEAQTTGYENEQALMARGIQGRVAYQVYNAIKEASSIEDRRSEFY